MNRNFGFLAKKAGGQGTRTNPIVNISRSAAGNVITFNIDSNLPSGQELYYSIDGTVSTNDFIAETLTGNVTLDINGNASVDFTANLEPTGNVSEFFFNLRKTSISGISLGTSGNVVLESNNAVNATGGTIEAVGNVIYHTFNTSNADFNIGNASSNAVIQFLMVARGGAAGNANIGGGGGGAGQVGVGKMRAINNSTYRITPATTVTNQFESTITGVTANIIISEPAGGAYPSNSFVSLNTFSGGNGGLVVNYGNLAGLGQNGGSGGGGGALANSPAAPAVLYAPVGGGTRLLPSSKANIANGGLEFYGNNGNVSQYWNFQQLPGGSYSNVRTGGGGGGGATSKGLCSAPISGTGNRSTPGLDSGGNGGNAYVWIDGNPYAAGGAGFGRQGVPGVGGINGTSPVSIAGAGAGPGVPEANVYGLVKFVYEMLPRNIEIL
jgi:hypothetical protein